MSEGMEDLAEAVVNQTQIIQLEELEHLDREKTEDMVDLEEQTHHLEAAEEVLVLMEIILRLIFFNAEAMVEPDRRTQLLEHP